MKLSLERLKSINKEMLSTTKDTIKTIELMGKEIPDLMIFTRDQHLLIDNELAKEVPDIDLVNRSMAEIEKRVKTALNGTLEINMSAN